MTIPKLNFFETMIMAENGNARAQFALGVMYHEGKGMPQDYAKAVRWFRDAANQGNAYAQHNLGVMYAILHYIF
jgi:FOG: TPR repeat, SEL1 subfamily